MAQQSSWTEESMKEFDSWMDKEAEYQKLEFTHVAAGDFKNADRAHELRWRCMDLAVQSLREKVVVS